MIFTSTFSIYEKNYNKPIKENEPPSAKNFYGKSKYQIEQIIKKSKIKYFTILREKKIKYLFIKKNSQITVVFFHGLMSDMIGAKPAAIQKFCKKKKLNFLKFEYSGHGKSKGKFTEGNISQWTNEAKQLIKSKIKKNNSLVFVGSSMGSWIALNLFSTFRKKIKGFL